MTRLDEGYANNRPSEWARIDMLLALFDGVVDHLTCAIAAADDNRASVATRHRLQAMSLVSALQSGLDYQYDEIPKKLNQLYEYVQFTLVEGDLDLMRSANKVLAELRDGFNDIRQQALELERQGKIPALSIQPTIDEQI